MSEQIETALGKFIAEVIAERNLSQRGFADLAGVSPKTVSRIVNGEAADPAILNRLAAYLNEPPEKLFRLAGYLPPASEREAVAEFVVHLFQQLPEDRQRRILEMLKMEMRLLEEEQRERQQKAKT